MDPFARNGLCKVTHAVSRQGAVITAELQHAGMYANRMQEPPGIAYGPVDCYDQGRRVHAMTEEFIEYTIEKYAKAAGFTKSCGFGMVTKVLEITETGVRCQAEAGQKYMRADTVIYAVGQQPLQEEGAMFRNCAPEFYQVGDCETPSNIMTATSAAFAIARNVGRDIC